MDPGGYQRGFTLIELLVVILIIAILAAIALPVYLTQREKSLVSQVESALKNAASALETYSTENQGSFAGVAGADSALDNAQYQVLTAEGYKKAATVEITVATSNSNTQYCITSTHATLPAGHEWKVATYNGSDGAPGPQNVDDC